MALTRELVRSTLGTLKIDSSVVETLCGQQFDRLLLLEDRKEVLHVLKDAGISKLGHRQQLMSLFLPSAELAHAAPELQSSAPAQRQQQAAAAAPLSTHEPIERQQPAAAEAAPPATRIPLPRASIPVSPVTQSSFLAVSPPVPPTPGRGNAPVRHGAAPASTREAVVPGEAGTCIPLVPGPTTARALMNQKIKYFKVVPSAVKVRSAPSLQDEVVAFK